MNHVQLAKPGTPQYFKFLQAAKEYYQQFEPKIIELTARGFWFNAYAFDWLQTFSEAEYTAWCFIRSTPRIQLYPQYPVGKYFVDFGNPYHRIALEVDGKDYHDPAKDKIRDQQILDEQGWKVFRVTGAEVHKYLKWEEDLELEDDTSTMDKQDRFLKEQQWLLTTAEGVIKAIAECYFNNKIHTDEGWRYRETLEAHRLVQFYL